MDIRIKNVEEHDHIQDVLDRGGYQWVTESKIDSYLKFKAKEVDSIMENITDGANLEIIRDALEYFIDETEDDDEDIVYLHCSCGKCGQGQFHCVENTKTNKVLSRGKCNNCGE